MARDAFEAGPNNDYPAFPRRGDGSPYWSDTAATDGIGISVNGRVVAPMPRGLRLQGGVLIDMTPRRPDGQPITPPTLP